MKKVLICSSMALFLASMMCSSCSLQNECEKGGLYNCDVNDGPNCFRVCNDGFYQDVFKVCHDNQEFYTDSSLQETLIRKCEHGCQGYQCYQNDSCDGVKCEGDNYACRDGKCVDVCKESRCNKDETCVKGECIKGCEGDECEVKADCKDGHCDESCGGVQCKDFQICINEKCVESCEQMGCHGPNDACIDGVCVDLCYDVICSGENETCQMGKCIDFCDVNPCDDNGNHMIDRYETAPNQGMDCRKYTDCDTKPHAGDGFCDSFIGYKCSTKCTSDDQCMSDEFFCRSDYRCAPKAFETAWKTTTDNEKILLPIFETYDITIDWGDGSSKLVAKTDDGQELSHVYADSGEHLVRITGSGTWSMKEDIYDASYAKKLIAIMSYGPIGIGKYAFQNADNLAEISVVDIPDAKLLTKSGYVFSYATNFNFNVENWDVSKVTSMHDMFSYTKKFNQPLNRWDISSATTIYQMFTGTSKFNQDLNDWDTSNVTNMYAVFYNNPVFNGNISSWNTSNVKNMKSMFVRAKSFNQDINGWDVSNVTSLYGTFDGASSFDQALPDWNISKTISTIANLFENSGISKENYCKTVMGPYKDVWAKTSAEALGVSYSCK